jgi:hypothetical protein
VGGCLILAHRKERAYVSVVIPVDVNKFPSSAGQDGGAAEEEVDGGAGEADDRGQAP